MLTEKQFIVGFLVFISYSLFYNHIDFQLRPCKNAITYCQKYILMPLFIQTGCNHKIGLFQVSCFAFPLILYKES